MTWSSMKLSGYLIPKPFMATNKEISARKRVRNDYEPIEIGHSQRQSGRCDHRTVVPEKSGWRIKLASRNYFPDVDDQNSPAPLCFHHRMSRYVESGMLMPVSPARTGTAVPSPIEVIADLVYSGVSKKPTRWVIAAPSATYITRWSWTVNASPPSWST